MLYCYITLKLEEANGSAQFDNTVLTLGTLVAKWLSGDFKITA